MMKEFGVYYYNTIQLYLRLSLTSVDKTSLALAMQNVMLRKLKSFLNIYEIVNTRDNSN